MKMFIRKLILNQEGINTVEIVILVAIAIGLALIFRAQISNFLNIIFADTFDTSRFALPTVTPVP